MKALTDIQQSKKLAEILPLESADMYYQYVLPKSGKIKHNPELGNPINALKWYNKGYTTSGKEPITLDEYCVPCWSLAALLGVMPKGEGKDLSLVFGSYDGGYHPLWFCTYEETPTILEICAADNPIDACVEMIYKLKEKDLL